MPNLAHDHNPNPGAMGGIPADEIRAVLLDAVHEIGELPLFKLEEALGVVIAKELERLAQEMSGSGWLNGKEFNELIGRVGLLLPKLPSRSSALVPLIKQLVATLNEMRTRSAAP